MLTYIKKRLHCNFHRRINSVILVKLVYYTPATAGTLVNYILAIAGVLISYCQAIAGILVNFAQQLLVVLSVAIHCLYS